MKKLLVVFVMSLSFVGAVNAQKIGYINTEELMSVMPETALADKQLNDYQELLQNQGNELAKDLQEADSAYVADSLKMNEKTKEIVRNSLMEKYQKVAGWQQSMQNELQKMGQIKVQPIRDKALEAIKAVAKANGYAYVLDMTSIIVAPPGDNILELVKKHLGIKNTPAQPVPGAAPATGGAKPKQQ